MIRTRASILCLVHLFAYANSSAATCSKCNNYPALSGDIENRAVDMIDDPLRHFDEIMIPIYNNSAIEDWSHDATSGDALSRLAFTSSRGSIGGVPGAQRVFVSLVWPNGTRYMENIFTEQSNLEICTEKTVGRWFNASSETDWTFKYSSDFKHTLVTIKSPTIQGTIRMEAFAPPLYPNGLEFPNPAGNTLFAPLLYWVENVPTGTVEANLTVLNTPFKFIGIGGRERNWLSLAWGSTSASWDMMRGVVGPYRFIGWTHESKIEGSQFSMVLLKDDKFIFRTERAGSFSLESWATISQTNTGPVHLKSPPDAMVSLPESTFTGYTIQMNSPATQEYWRFEVEFVQTVYWFPVGRAAHIGGYTAKAHGGIVGGYSFSGLSSGNVQELSG